MKNEFSNCTHAVASVQDEYRSASDVINKDQFSIERAVFFMSWGFVAIANAALYRMCVVLGIW